MATATYVSASTLIVQGDYTNPQCVPRGLPIVAVLTSGPVQTKISAAIYRVETDDTLISVTEPVLDNTLTAIKQPGPGYVDRESQTSNIPEHLHTAAWDGGEAAFAGFTDSDSVAYLNSLAEKIAAGLALQILRKNTNNTDIEFADLNLDALLDVDISNKVNGYVLTYDSVTGLIKLKAPTGGTAGGTGTGVGSWAGYFLGL